jgi:hypothetical protein
MSARFLTWYTCGVFSLASFLTLFVSVGPGAEARFAVLQALLGGAALLFAAIGVVLANLPREHWCNRSVPVRCLFIMAAIVSSLLVAVSVG